MKAGETKRFSCDQCSIEYDVTYEPKAQGDPQTARKLPEYDMDTCPNCGGSATTDD